MRYLIIIRDPVTGKQSAFFSSRYDYENLYSAEHEMIVIDRSNNLVSFNGKDWEDIEEDHL